MDTLLARYFDGDLDDREARILLERVENEPALRKELRAYEQMLTMSTKLASPKAPAGFTERVMAGIAPLGRWERARSRPHVFSRSFGAMAAAAAVVILAYIGGWWMGRGRMMLVVSERTAGRAGAIDDVTPVQGSGMVAAGSELRYVRLAYHPTDPSVQRVTVAGSFNDWNPNSTALQKQNGVWVTVLVLAPGTYEYMFVEDETQWMTDPMAVRMRDDGFGGLNAVLDVEL
ncbi:MAG: hypothetical protein ABIA59_06440 [Candidatus Latescibacterota bacterium]